MTDECCLLLEQVRHSALIMRLKREGCHSFDFTLQLHTFATFDKLCLHQGNVRELSITKSFTGEFKGTLVLKVPFMV